MPGGGGTGVDNGATLSIVGSLGCSAFPRSEQPGTLRPAFPAVRMFMCQTAPSVTLPWLCLSKDDDCYPPRETHSLQEYSHPGQPVPSSVAGEGVDSPQSPQGLSLQPGCRNHTLLQPARVGLGTGDVQIRHFPRAKQVTVGAGGGRGSPVNAAAATWDLCPQPLQGCQGCGHPFNVL